MSEIKIALMGHRFVEDILLLERRLMPIIEGVYRSGNSIVWYVGRNGDFDECAASLIKRIRKRYYEVDSQLVLVLPYRVKDIEYYENYYDGIIIPEACYHTHHKRAITVRNRWMVDNSDLALFYVERCGGAANAMSYAERMGKRYINVWHNG